MILLHVTTDLTHLVTEVRTSGQKVSAAYVFKFKNKAMNLNTSIVPSSITPPGFLVILTA